MEKGAVGKQNVAVMAESTPLEDIETGKNENKFASLKEGSGWTQWWRNQ